MSTFRLFALLVLGVFSALRCAAQEPCDQYVKKDADVVKYKADLKDGPSKKLRDKLQKASLDAAGYLVKCEQGRTSTPLEKLNAYYQIGKYYTDAGNCEQAQFYFNLCLQVPIAATTQFKQSGKTYKTKINEIEQVSCVKKTNESVYGLPVRKISVSYRGKMGIEVEDNGIFTLVNKNNLDNNPYTIDEIESMNDALFLQKDSSAAINFFKKRFKDTAVMYFKAPFLLIDVNHALLLGDKDLTQEQIAKNEVSKPGSNDLDFSIKLFKKKDKNSDKIKSVYTSRLPQSTALINAFLSRLAVNYGISLSSKYIHVLYLYDSDITNDDFKDYLNFCNTIHYRYPGLRIGYFNTYDKSLVSWLATGQGTFAHEFIHLLIDDDYPDAPSWLNEGMASLQEEAKYDGSPVDNWRLVYLKYFYEENKGYLSLEQILEECRDCDDYNGIIHDCFSRYLCFYLYQAGKLNDVYQAFKTIGTLPPYLKQKEVLEQLLNKPSAQIEQDFYCWLNQRVVPSKWAYEKFAAFIRKYVSHNKSTFTANAPTDTSSCPFVHIVTNKDLR